MVCSSYCTPLLVSSASDSEWTRDSESQSSHAAVISFHLDTHPDPPIEEAENTYVYEARHSESGSHRFTGENRRSPLMSCACYRHINWKTVVP